MTTAGTCALITSLANMSDIEDKETALQMLRKTLHEVKDALEYDLTSRRPNHGGR